MMPADSISRKTVKLSTIAVVILGLVGCASGSQVWVDQSGAVADQALLQEAMNDCQYEEKLKAHQAKANRELELQMANPNRQSSSSIYGPVCMPGPEQKECKAARIREQSRLEGPFWEAHQCMKDKGFKSVSADKASASAK